MKKFIALAILAFSGVTFAGGFGSIGYEGRDGVNGTEDSRATKVTIGTDLTDKIKADFSIRQKTDDNLALKDNRVEAGLTYARPLVGNLSMYTRGAVGQKFKTTEDYTYYSVEPGVKYAVTPALSVKAGYRYRSATSDAHADTTRAYRLGAEYALTKNYFVGVGYDRVRGDSDYNTVSATVGFKF